MKFQMTIVRVILTGLLGISRFAVAGSSEAAEQSAAELLPSTTVAYVELTDPSELVRTVLDHPVRRWLENQHHFRQALEEKDCLQFKAVVAVVEAELGRIWPRILASAAGQGAYLGVDTKTEGVAVLLKSQDEETQQQLVDALLLLARVAENQRGADPVKVSEHRSVKVYEFNQARVAVFGRWLAVSNKGPLLRRLIDNSHEKSDATLASQEPFQQSRQADSGDSTAWGYLNLSALREAGIGRSLSRATMDSPVGELFAGGALSVLRQAPYLTAGLNVRRDRLCLQLASPHDPQWVEERREYFFGPASAGAAPPLLAIDGSLFSMSTYRDVSQWWLRAGELFSEQISDELAQADSNLSTLFSGKDFGADILSAVQPQIQLIVARQGFDAETLQPAIKLPAFGLVFRLKDPDRMLGDLRRTFHSLIEFLNIIGSMNGLPRLDLNIDLQEDYQLVTSSYVHEAGQDTIRLPINFNFSPTIGFAGERFVVASTKKLARQLALGQATAVAATGGQQNTAAVADVALLRTVLADNRQQLIAQNMLQEGHTRAEAEHEIKALLELLGFVRDVSLRFGTVEKTLRLVVVLRLSEG